MNVMARLRSSSIYGKGDDMGLCKEHDEPMALFSLICHYRVNNNDNEESLRAFFENLYKHLVGGQLRKSIEQARKKLIEANELTVDMKWTTTGKKIYEKLSHHDHNMQDSLKLFKDSTPADSQTRGSLDQMFAKIIYQYEVNEKLDDSTTKYGNGVFGRIEKECRDGRECTRSNCPFGHPKGKGKGKGKTGEGKGKGKGKGKDKHGGKGQTSTCQKPGCINPQLLSEYRKLCTTCFNDLGAKGLGSESTLKDGTTFKIKSKAHTAACAAVKRDRETPEDSPFDAKQEEFLMQAMNATARMAANGNMDDDTYGGPQGPKCSKKKKSGIDAFMENMRNSQ